MQGYASGPEANLKRLEETLQGLNAGNDYFKKIEGLNDNYKTEELRKSNTKRKQIEASILKAKESIEKKRQFNAIPTPIYDELGVRSFNPGSLNFEQLRIKAQELYKKYPTCAQKYWNENHKQVVGVIGTNSTPQSRIGNYVRLFHATEQHCEYQKILSEKEKQKKINNQQKKINLIKKQEETRYKKFFNISNQQNLLSFEPTKEMINDRAKELSVLNFTPKEITHADFVEAGVEIEPELVDHFSRNQLSSLLLKLSKLKESEHNAAINSFIENTMGKGRNISGAGAGTSTSSKGGKRKTRRSRKSMKTRKAKRT